MPWSCRRSCGRIRQIKVLKVKSYECPVCKYTWEVKKVCDEIVDQYGNPIESEASVEDADAKGKEEKKPTEAKPAAEIPPLPASSTSFYMNDSLPLSSHQINHGTTLKLDDQSPMIQRLGDERISSRNN
ncbi:MAG: hypothetical protein R3C03_09555 [Pirellulaceae bacterium]